MFGRRLTPPSTISPIIQALSSRLGRARPELGLRSVGVPRYSYTIYYRIAETHIEIVHVRDDRRQPLPPGEL
jgi:plasmid stabilization system protein ParE